MPLTEKQKEALKEMSDDERAEFLEVLGIKQSKGSDDVSALAKTVELLQKKVASLEKTPRKPAEPTGWFERVFGGN
jgi:hypothetical protein